jgi:hypothetical protein
MAEMREACHNQLSHTYLRPSADMNVELHYKGDSNRDEEYVMNKTE